MSRNVADAAQVQRDTRRVKRGDQRRVDAMRTVMGAESGRLILRSLIEDCGVFAGGFEPNSSQQYFDAGARNVGLRLMAECERADARLFRTMEDEARARIAVDARQAEPVEPLGQSHG